MKLHRISGGLVLAILILAGSPDSPAAPREQRLKLANQFLEFDLVAHGGRCVATRLVNKPARSAHVLKSDDFSIGIGMTGSLTAWCG